MVRARGADSADDQDSRAGWDEKSIVAVEVARMAEGDRRGGDCRASADAPQGYSGRRTGT